MTRDNSQRFLDRLVDELPMVPAERVRQQEEVGWTVLLGSLERGHVAFYFNDQGEALSFSEWAACRVEGADTFDVVVTYSAAETQLIFDNLADEWREKVASK